MLDRKEGQIELNRSNLLKNYGRNDFFMFSRWSECEDLPFKSYCDSLKNLCSSSGQHHVVSIEAGIGEAAVVE